MYCGANESIDPSFFKCDIGIDLFIVSEMFSSEIMECGDQPKWYPCGVINAQLEERLKEWNVILLAFPLGIQ